MSLLRVGAAVFLAAVVVALGPGGATLPVEAGTPANRFLVVPADVASNKSPVELRVAVANPGRTAASYTVTFTRDTRRGPQPLAPVVRLRVPARGLRLANAWWTPRGVSGAQTLRYVLRRGATVVGRGSWQLQVLDVTTKSPPKLTAAWVEPGHVLADRDVDAAHVSRLVDQMHSLGMDTIILAYVEFEWSNGWGPFYPSKIPELGEQEVAFDLVGTILRRASRNGMHVVLGLGRGPNGPANLDGPNASTEEMDAAAAFGTRVAKELWQLYGHEPSLYGWYISHEANDYRNAEYLYNQQARALHAISPEKVVMVAPAGTPIGIDRAHLDRSDVDIYAYQDAVGPGYVGPDASCQPRCVPYTYSYEPQNRIRDLRAIFSKYAAAHAGSRKHIWADTEVWQMSGPAYAYPYAAPCRRLGQQIEAEAPYVSQMSAYEYFGYMKAPTDELQMQQPYSRELFDGYKAFVTGKTKTLCPNGDTAMHKCSPQYELTRQVVMQCRPV